MKRKRDKSRKGRPRKKQQQDQQDRAHSNVQHSVLNSLYNNVWTLEKLLLHWLPPTSRVRQKRLMRFDSDFPSYAGFLSSILVGFNARASVEILDARRKELISFTQTQRKAGNNSRDQQNSNVSEIVDYTIWSLFQREQAVGRAPDHLLCHGYQKATSLRKPDHGEYDIVLPGVIQRSHNPSVDALKGPPWREIANILGGDSEAIISSLILDCGIFQRLEHGRDNLYQVSGEPISKFSTTSAETTTITQASRPNPAVPTAQSFRSILVARNRMFYAKPSMNQQGKVQLGLKHNHALNRFCHLDDAIGDLRITQYIFPRQFGLHNVFTSIVTPGEGKHTSKDYTFREQEIESVRCNNIFKLPRRLRGGPIQLVHKLRKNHYHCSYSQMLRHYCSVNPGRAQYLSVSHLDSGIPTSSILSTPYITQLGLSRDETIVAQTALPTSTSSFMQYATPIGQVSIFCQAILLRVLPQDVFGRDVDGKRNWTTLLTSIDEFLSLRRFDTFDLNRIFSTMKLRCIDWLCPPKIQQIQKLSMSDKAKRLEILKEFLYYIFDSLVIPLVRSNFYVTETGVYRNRLFYFRHDVWKRLVDPSLSTLKLSMFEPLTAHHLKQFSTESTLGYSQMRLLPKANGVRPIMNLKSKAIRIVGGKQISERGINKQLEPIFSVLKLERHRQPEKLASAIFSIGEIREKLKAFKSRLSSPYKPFCFAKVDIQSCFDTIPQEELLDYVKAFLPETEYRTNKHVEMKHISTLLSGTNGRPVARWVSRAMAVEQNPLLTADTAGQLSTNKHRHVYIRQDQQDLIKITRIRKMMQDHLQHNIVSIGRQHFRQINGIPQGSILSSLLCNLFYGDFERRELGFLDPQNSLLLRLTDDFLLITTDEAQARRFVHCMSRGSVNHGICVNPDKSLVNFEVSIQGHKIPRLHGIAGFPYCGMTIDTRNLHVYKDRQQKDVYVGNGLTIAHVARHGNGLQAKVVSSLRRQMHAVVLDGSINPRAQVLGSIFECFVECGMKMHQHLRSCSRGKRPSQAQQIQLCSKLIKSASKTMQRIPTSNPVVVTRSQMSWLATVALAEVLSRKQSEYRLVLSWLHSMEETARRSMNMNTQELQALRQCRMKKFVDYVY